MLHGPAGLHACCLSHAAAALRSEPASIVVWANHPNLLRLLEVSDRPIRIALRPDRGRPPVPDPAVGPQEDGAATRPGPGRRYDGATSGRGPRCVRLTSCPRLSCTRCRRWSTSPRLPRRWGSASRPSTYSSGVGSGRPRCFGSGTGSGWQDVDLDRGFLHVVQQITDVRGRRTVGTPKTKGGSRVLSLDPTTVRLLAVDHRATQAAERDT